MKRKLEYGPIPPEGKPRVSLRIRLPDRTVIAEIAPKSLRKAQAAEPPQVPTNHGVDGARFRRQRRASA